MQQQIFLGPMPTYQTRSAEIADISALTCGQAAVEEAERMMRPKRLRRDKNGQPGLATVMGCSLGEVSKRLNKRWGEAVDQIIEFENTAHTRVITQYMAWSHGGLWVPRELSESEKQAQELAELRAKVAQLEAAA